VTGPAVAVDEVVVVSQLAFEVRVERVDLQADAKSELVFVGNDRGHVDQLPCLVVVSAPDLFVGAREAAEQARVGPLLGARECVGSFAAERIIRLRFLQVGYPASGSNEDCFAPSAIRG
jgi:hypothetical protein